MLVYNIVSWSSQCTKIFSRCVLVTSLQDPIPSETTSLWSAMTAWKDRCFPVVFCTEINSEWTSTRYTHSKPENPPYFIQGFRREKIHAFHKDINAKVNGIGYVEIIIRLAELIFYANKLTLSKYFINDVNKQ